MRFAARASPRIIREATEPIEFGAGEVVGRVDF
jgi:hypothetical protein